VQLSIIIVNYNVRYFLEQCLLSVQDALRGIGGEIIVVDNISPDDSCEMVKNKFPDVILIENKVNIGFSKANNQGVAIAKGKYVLILNPDTVVAEDSFSKIIAFAEKTKNLGMLGVKLVDGTGNFLPESKRGLPTPKVAFNKLFGVSNTSTGKYYATHLDEDEMGFIEILVGAFMFMERQKYNEINGFDEDYFMYGEDIDISYKMFKKGYKNYYFPKTQIIHYKGESTSKNAKYLGNFYGAMRIFYRKHFHLNILFDFSMNLGIKFWYWIKFFQIKNTTSKPITPKNVLYIGNENPVYESLRKSYKNSEVHIFAVCETRVVSRYDDLEKLENILKDKQIDEIVFDNQSNSFSKIIFYMTSLKNKGINFKIRPRETRFIIGSDNKNNMGAVIQLQFES
jgi:GT2 family glycosyltransferase